MTRDPQQVDDHADRTEPKPVGLFSEMLDFVRHYKKWWLFPIIGLLLLVGTIAVLSRTAAAPFIYALF